MLQDLRFKNNCLGDPRAAPTPRSLSIGQKQIIDQALPLLTIVHRIDLTGGVGAYISRRDSKGLSSHRAV
jgi:hypothetical protein